jgi:tRNA(Ile)-lysidine synthase
VIRPLLPWGRAEIDAWLADRRLDWREDSSNTDTERLRNRVRHRLLPELERAAPAIRSHLVRLAGALAEDEAFLAAELDRRIGFIDPWEPDGGLELAELAALPRALRTRWLHGQMHRLGIGRTTRQQLELFHRLLDHGEPRAVTMGGRWRLRAAGARLWAEPPTPLRASAATLVTGRTVALSIPGWQARCCAPSDADPDARWRRSTRSADTTVTVRTAVAGETVPNGVGGRRRVRDLLAARLPRHLRSGWPVFCENDMIYWIPGVWQHPDPGDPTDRVVEVIRQ